MTAAAPDDGSRVAEARAGSLLVVIPALDEEESVAAVVAAVRRAQPDAVVLVVDDGSTDATARNARRAGARVMPLPYNLGVGGALRAAFRYAYDEGYRAVVQVDADGQHDPDDIAALLDAAARQEADIVVGARFAGRGDYVMRGPRRWAMRVLSWVLSRLIGVPLSDPTSGFRVVNARALRVFAHDFPEEYLGDTVEALVIAHRAGLRIAQVGVAMRPREAGRASQGPIRSAAYLVRAMTAVFLAVARRGTVAADPSS